MRLHELTELDATLERQIGGLLQDLPERIDKALVAAIEADHDVQELRRVCDEELFGGIASLGSDLEHELADALRHLRNAARIAEQRNELGRDDQEAGSHG